MDSQLTSIDRTLEAQTHQMMSDLYQLSKSTFLIGLQCPKSLMLHVLHPEQRESPDAQAQMRMRLGQEVGKLARQRYPGGEIGRIPGAGEASLKRTQELIGNGVDILYEPAFSHAGVFILVDILVRGRHGWRLIEVKSASRVKDQHLWDLAVQLYVLRGVGMTIEDAVLLHMNGDYVRKGPIDLSALFSEATLVEEVEPLLVEVAQSVRSSLEHLAANQIPERDIGPYCKDPEVCDYQRYCWKHIPDPSVFDVYRLPTKKKFALYTSGITRIEDIPGDFEMGDSASFHTQAHKSSKPILERAALQSFLQELHYPLFFLDFETFSVPIPRYDGLSPYSHVPFQYSLHVQDEAGQEPRHSGFLAAAGEDPRQEFLDHMLDETEGQGDIIVYNINFERTVLLKLAQQLPEYANAITARVERLVDLMEPFRQRLYWTPVMGGSVSLKAVMPALVPELSYKELQVQDGTQAMDVFLKLEDLGDSEAAELQRQALWAYCTLDTLAMVRILEALFALI